MKYGLSEQQIKEITNIISSYDDIEKAIIFGSRATNKFKKSSDIDISIQGEKPLKETANNLQYTLNEETYLPFFFDVLDYNSLSNDELKKEITKKGKIIYNKTIS